MSDCNDCGEITGDIEEYCHRCGKMCCFDCLNDEWCLSCLRQKTLDDNARLSQELGMYEDD